MDKNIATTSVSTQEYTDWRKQNFCEDHMDVTTLHFSKGKIYGPFFCVHSKEKFKIQNTSFAHDANEQGHWVGLTQPTSPQDAKQMYALPENNTAKYLFRIILTPKDNDSKGFIGIPKLQSDTGATLAINLNNKAVSIDHLQIETYMWSDSENKYKNLENN